MSFYVLFSNVLPVLLLVAFRFNFATSLLFSSFSFVVLFLLLLELLLEMMSQQQVELVFVIERRGETVERRVGTFLVGKGTVWKQGRIAALLLLEVL